MGALQDELDAQLARLGVPGAVAGIVLDGEEEHAYAGVTSVANPLPVDASTLFQFGSTGKTYTATALVRLAELGRVDLEAPVRRYVPELRLQDEHVAERVTVLQLLNHTAGWEGDGREDDSTGDDALERFVASMARLQQTSPLGATVSYNNAALCLAGRVVEKVTGQVFEDALRELVLDPLGLHDTWFNVRDMDQVMTRRFAVGHNRAPDGTVTVARPWALPRGGTPAGGMCATLADQLAWARFHLGDGAPLLGRGRLDAMKQPTADMRGSALGDFVGTSWLLRDVDGCRLVGHGGTVIGQYSDFVLVPELGFAFTSMSNCGPNGAELNHALQAWALEHYCGLRQAEPQVLDLPAEQLQEYAGRFETVAAICDVTVSGGRLSVAVSYKPGALSATGDDDPDPQPPFVLGLTAPDRYVVAEGPAKGMKGYFARDAAGLVTGVHLGGRLATRVPVPA